ncbi:MAG: hypothetical protein R3308_00755 [Thiohalobacterales bacterium]|nr:hypothetical protein [Thiohalobacterales bacterium]
MKEVIVISTLLMLAIIIAHPASASADSWQERMLFSPSPAQLSMERSRGRVMIYEGLKDVQVAEAMDSQFDRIEHMMFTGTVVTDDRGEVLLNKDTGQPVIEEDGCE